MSVYFVGEETLNAVVTLILRAGGPRSLDDANSIGKSLWMSLDQSPSTR
jgi:hypothetical protein